MIEREKEEKRLTVNALVARLKEKDFEAATELNRIMWSPIYNFAYSLCSDAEYAKDLAQDTFRTVLTLAKEGKVRYENCPSWMMGIVFRLSKNFSRKKHRKDMQVEDSFLESKLTYDNLYDQVHMKMAFEKLLAKEAAVVSLHIEGYTYKEIGEMLNMSESTVKRTRLDALLKLEKEYKK